MSISASREDSELAPIDDDGLEIPLPSHNELRVAIQRLKNNKAAGCEVLRAELFKTRDDELVRSLSAEYGWKKASSAIGILVLCVLS